MHKEESIMFALAAGLLLLVGLFTDEFFTSEPEWEMWQPTTADYSQDASLEPLQFPSRSTEASVSSEGDSLVSGIDFGDRGELDAGAANTGYKFVSTREGTLIRVPENWEGRVADNGRGLVYQEPGAFGNGNMIRIMDPTPAYPRGYVVYYNEYGQPLDVFGRAQGGLPGHEEHAMGALATGGVRVLSP